MFLCFADKESNNILFVFVMATFNFREGKQVKFPLSKLQEVL